MKWILCQQQTPTSRQLHRSGRSKSTGRGIEDEHNTPIIESVLWERRKWGGWVNCRHCQQPTPTSSQRNWSRRSKSTERSFEGQRNTDNAWSGRWAKRKWAKWMKLQALPTTGTNKQETWLVKKEQEHWAMHWRQTRHSNHWIWNVSKKSEKDGWIADIANNQYHRADNGIGAEGARALSEALKTSTTLQSLNLRSEQKRKWDRWVNCRHCQQPTPTSRNIGDEGARALSEALKTNTTLQML